MPSLSLALSLALALIAICCAQNTSAPLDNCSNLSSCQDCLTSAQMGCGWCAPTLSCHTGTRLAPSDGTVCTQEWFGAGGTMGAAVCPELQCPTYGNCVSCLKEKSCGWCDAPDGGVASCQALGQTCPGGAPVEASCPCQNYNTCEDCVDDGGCVFCISSRSCETIDPNGNCKNNDPNDQLITECPCSAWSDCDTCNDVEGCGWCGGKDPSTSCVNLQDATCQLTHTCGRTSRGSHFNAGSFVGGMFVMLGAIVLLAGAYFLYTNWASRRNAYQQVN